MRSASMAASTAKKSSALSLKSLCRRRVSDAVKVDVASSVELVRNIEEVGTSPLVERIASEICGLDLLETSQLVSLLRKRLRLPEVSMMHAGAYAAPPPGAGPSVQAATGTQLETNSEPAVAQQTEFSITLEKIDTASKAKVIREIKMILPHLNLVEAKTFVESAPKLIKDKLKKDEAEKIKTALEAVGASISMS
jgi:large subunit ribosomal protein L7/L12